MPLSDSQETQTNPIFDAVVAQVGENITNIFPDDNSRRFYGSLLAGGRLMACAVATGCQGFREACGDINKAKALALTELFTLLMLSQTFRWLESQESEPKNTDSLNLSAVSLILKLFGDNSEQSIADFITMDTQFRYDLKNRDHFTHLAVILLARACEVCGHRCIDWSKVSFPIKSLQPLATSRALVDAAKINGVEDIRVVIRSLDSAVKAMVKYYEEHAKP
jgi:hypothetical protein